MRSLPGSRPASKRSCRRRANSARREGTSLAARRASFASSVAAFSLLRLRSSCHFSEPARARESTSAQRSASARASGRIRPCPLLRQHRPPVTRRLCCYDFGRRPVTVVPDNEIQVGAEILVAHRHAFDDSASEIALPALLRGLHSMWMMHSTVRAPRPDGTLTSRERRIKKDSTRRRRDGPAPRTKLEDKRCLNAYVEKIPKENTFCNNSLRRFVTSVSRRRSIVWPQRTGCPSRRRATSSAGCTPSSTATRRKRC